ncbi:MAG: ABC transporter ATP-binding protein [Alphaproteobacteria bacterium]|jgi:lipoprotein-releasing system ATP-binding protein|nr:ABC transporter ATP-binding protein [Alphaproteobacteria bacterium]
MENNKIVLEFKNICKSFSQGGERLEVLDGANLSVAKGEIVSLLGPSGSGKSTLLQIIGLLDKADAGEIFVDGIEVSNANDEVQTKTRLDKIGFVYQSHNLFRDFTALENVMMPLLIQGENIEIARKKAIDLLEDLDLGDRMDHRPAELSGGQCQRVAIARALANEPEILLADEPTGNLDPETSEHVFAMLMKIVKEKALSCIIVTHNRELAKKAKKIVEIKNKKLEEI